MIAGVAELVDLPAGRQAQGDNVLYLIKMVAGVAELVDARDLKSLGLRAVPVQVRPPAPYFIGN